MPGSVISSLRPALLMSTRVTGAGGFFFGTWGKGTSGAGALAAPLVGPLATAMGPAAKLENASATKAAPIAVDGT
jgi:hypothetical protein